MQLKKQKLCICLVLAAMLSVFLPGISGKADAGIIPYSVIAPHEYQLPVGDEIPKNGTDLLLSYNTFRDEGKAWEGQSSARSLFVNIEKYVHIFKIDGLKNSGFLWEGVAGLGSFQGKDHTSTNGLIDAQTGLVGWYKPLKNWCNVLEYWLYLPTGNDNLSGHSWNHSFAYMTNFTLGNFTFDGDIGYKLMGDYDYAGVEKKQGDTVFANAVFAYKVMKQIEPFFKADYQSTNSGETVASSNPETTPLGTFSGNSELALGVGNQFQISDRLSLAIWYEAGVTGRNTTKTNAGYCRFIWAF
jgi:hypothetical protein